MINAGTANIFSMRFGFILNSVFGRNSPVTNTIKVEMMVCKATFSPSCWFKWIGERTNSLITPAIKIP